MITLVLMIMIGASLSVFMGSSSVSEKSQFALVLGSGGLRFLGVMGIVLFCCFYIRRCFENKEIEFLLSRPISRPTFLVTHAIAFSILALFISVVITAVVALLGQPDTVGLLVWGASLAAEFSIMAVAALFFSMVLSSAAGSALATLGLYALGRTVGTLLGVLSATPENWFFAIVGSIMKLISVVTPRLDILGQTSWLVYGVDANSTIKLLRDASEYAYWMASHLGLVGFIVVQGALFTALLLAASAYDFMRRRF
jgi:ABC-type transport system involved in multi-copper enzyme maturation permease subunit